MLDLAAETDHEDRSRTRTYLRIGHLLRDASRGPTDSEDARRSSRHPDDRRQRLHKNGEASHGRALHPGQLQPPAKPAARKCTYQKRQSMWLHLGVKDMSGLLTTIPTADNHGAFNLRRTSDFQAALLAMAGHDLRQPLQVIQSAYEWLGDRVANNSEKAQLERGERAIGRLAEQLDRLIGALRLYEHSDTIELSHVPLGPLFRRIAGENEIAAREKGVDIRVHVTRCAAASNPVLLEGIVRNLVRNAVKYTDRGGCVLVGCRRSGHDVRIDVHDTGIGIAPQQLPKIFDAFHRLDTARVDGLGIGLFVVRRAVELLDHRIEVRSQLGRGSRFSVFAQASN
ncbi:HAMP domain-containing histidine kinase [Ensifer adhaerens]|nr:HAMP domain-containing histidine kinase [Ensifer canadensis]